MFSGPSPVEVTELAREYLVVVVCHHLGFEHLHLYRLSQSTVNLLGNLLPNFIRNMFGIKNFLLKVVSICKLQQVFVPRR